MQHGGEKPEGRQAPTHRGKRGHGSSQQELLASPTATRCHPTEPPLSSREAAPNQRVQSLHTSIHRQAGTDRAWRSCCFPAWIHHNYPQGRTPVFHSADGPKKSRAQGEEKAARSARPRAPGPGSGHLRATPRPGRPGAASPGPAPRSAPLPAAGARGRAVVARRGSSRRGPARPPLFPRTRGGKPLHRRPSASGRCPAPGSAPTWPRRGVARRERTLRPPRRLRHSPSRSRARCGPPRGGGTAAGRGAAGEGKRQRGAPAPGALVGQRAASVMGAGRAGGARHSGAWSPPALPAPRREAAAAAGGGLRLPESAAPLGLGRDERRAAAVPLGRSRPSSSPWKGSVRGCCGRCAGPSGTLGAGPAAGGRQAG